MSSVKYSIKRKIEWMGRRLRYIDGAGEIKEWAAAMSALNVVLKEVDIKGSSDNWRPWKWSKEVAREDPKAAVMEMLKNDQQHLTRYTEPLPEAYDPAKHVMDIDKEPANLKITSCPDPSEIYVLGNEVETGLTTDAEHQMDPSTEKQVELKVVPNTSEKTNEVEHTEGHKIGPSVELQLQEWEKSENPQPMSEGAKAILGRWAKRDNSQPMSEGAKALLGKWAKRRKRKG